MRLWSFLRRLFRGRPSPPAGDPAKTEAAPSATVVEADAAPPPEPPSHSRHEARPAQELVVEEDEDDWGDGDEDEDLDGEPDPFIQGTETVVNLPLADAATLRAQARSEALRGEHRLPLSSAAGPGSLAEALNILVAEGLVEAEFVDEPPAGPLMVYRPLKPGT